MRLFLLLVLSLLALPAEAGQARASSALAVVRSGPSGEIASLAEANEIRIVTGTDETGAAFVEIHDTGCGIPAGILNRIFEPFFTTKEVGKGTGLGLATAFGVVREHGGFIEVNSEVGRGTTFRLLFPLFDGAPHASDPSNPDALRGGTETLLLVEDERSVRSLLVDVLSGLGYRVIEAENGVQALALARDHGGEIALAVTDLVMPGGISGLDLGRELAAVRPGTKVIYVSGFSTETAVKRADLVDGVNFLPKPFSPRVLARMIREQLDAN